MQLDSGLLIRVMILNMGARPLRRTIQNEVEDVLAERILMGKVHAGNKVKITVKDNKLNFILKRGMNK